MEKSVHVGIFKACVYKYTYKNPRWRGGVQGKGPERAALASRAGEHGGKLAGGSQRLVCCSTASMRGWAGAAEVQRFCSPHMRFWRGVYLNFLEVEIL